MGLSQNGGFTKKGSFLSTWGCARNRQPCLQPGGIWNPPTCPAPNVGSRIDPKAVGQTPQQPTELQPRSWFKWMQEKYMALAATSVRGSRSVHQLRTLLPLQNQLSHIGGGTSAGAQVKCIQKLLASEKMPKPKNSHSWYHVASANI